MSQENVEAFKRFADASNRRDGVEVTPPLASVVDFKNGKAIRVRSYLDPKDALVDAALRE